MDSSMQDMIARYSRELLDYGLQHGGAVSGSDQTAPQNTQTVQTSQQYVAAEKAEEGTYIQQAAQQPASAAPNTQGATVLYEDFQAAGGNGSTVPGRVVFGRESSAPAPPRPVREQWKPTRPAETAVQPRQTQPAPVAPAGTGAAVQPARVAVAQGAQSANMMVNSAQRTTTQRAQQIQPRVQKQAPVQTQPASDLDKTAQTRIFAQLENEIVPLRPDGDSLGQNYTAAMSAGQNLPDLDVDTGDVLGFTSGDLLQLQKMNADRVQNIDVNSIISPSDGRGWLRVHVFASEARFPLSNARVVVFQTMNGKNYVIYDKLTDANGLVDSMVLPAPHKEYSLSPDGVSGKHSIPYASYNLYIEHPGFLRKSYPEISVFDGVDSVKPVILTPKSVGMTEVPAINFYAQ